MVYDTKRLAAIGSVLRKFGFGNLVRAARSGIFGDFDTSNDILNAFKDQPDSMAANLRAAIESLGTTYIKFGQMLSTRYDLLPKSIIDELSKLQDGSPKLPFETIESILNDAYGDYHTVFRSIDPAPLGAASIAQVHRAVLCSGENVVIKVQRPGLLPLIRSDIDILNFFAKIFDNTIDEIAYFNLPGLIKEFEDAIIEELNFNNERVNIEFFMNRYKNDARFVFPEPFADYCRPNILVMRELVGQKITSVEPDTPQAHDMSTAILDIAFEMVLKDGVFHGDPHPGNVFALADHTIGLLDFGLIGKFTQRQRMDFMHIVLGVQVGDYALIARTLLNMGHPTRRVVLSELEAEIATILQKYLKSSLQHLDITAFSSDFIAAGQHFGIQIPADYTNAVRALINVEGIIQYLNPNLDLLETLAQYAKRLLAENISQKNITNQILQDVLNVGDYARTLPSHAAQIMQDIEHDGIAMRISDASTAPLVNAINVQSARISISLSLPLLAFCFYLPGWMIPFYIVLALFILWVMALPFLFNNRILNRKKIRIKPWLSLMRRRRQWF